MMRSTLVSLFNRLFYLALAFGLVSLSPTDNLHAELVIDFSHDAANGDFFGNNPTAKAALLAATDQINQAFAISPAAIFNGVTTGTGGATSVQFDWDWNYSNPSTGAIEIFNGGNAVMPHNNVVVFAGMRLLNGSTLGQGSPGGISSSFTTNGLSNLQTAFDDAQANSEMHRGNGPVTHRTTGSVFGATYSFDHGPSIGSIRFDADSNDDGFFDSASQLDQYWHFDHTTNVAGGKNDFYTVALHELLHSIGFGIADSWDDNVNGNDWIGANLIAELGSGVNTINGHHFRTGLLGNSIVDGTSQEALMSSFLFTGTRKHLTNLDIAALVDSGWQPRTISIPEPCTFVFLALMFGGISCRRVPAKSSVEAC